MDADGNIVKSFKKSKQGKLKLVLNEDSYRTVTSWMLILIQLKMN
jgi:hypothetical protein